MVLFPFCVETWRAASLRYKSIPFPRNGFAKLIKIQIRNAARGGKKRKIFVFTTICIIIYYKNVKIFFAFFQIFL